MGVSERRNVPYCIEVLGEIAPRRVLDVSMRFGRWGMILRDICEVPSAPALSDISRLYMEAIEGFERHISGQHSSFYDQIHVGDVTELLRELPGPWDVTILDDVLQHIAKDVAIDLLRVGVERSAYVLVNVPLGRSADRSDSDGAPRDDLSSWDVAEFTQFPVVRRSLFTYGRTRPLGTFLLSDADPRGLREAPLSGNGGVADQSLLESRASELERVLARIGDVTSELHYTKQHTTFRLSTRLRESGIWNALRWLRNRNRRVATVRALGTHNEQSPGSEVWLLRASPNAGQPAVPWSFFEQDGEWVQQASEDSPAGVCLVGQRGRVRVPVDHDPELQFLTHPWSGMVEVAFQGRREVVDLYSPDGGRISVFPARSPMVVPRTPPRDGSAGEADGAVSGAARRPARALSDEQRVFIRTMRAAGAHVVAVHCPRWLGVTNSTRTLFTHMYPVPPSPSREPYTYSLYQLEQHADVLCEAGVRHVVFSGGDEVHYRLMLILHERDPDLRFDMLWHGNFVQFSQDYAWNNLRHWIDAVKDGIVHSIGTVKMGMEQFFQSAGVRSKVVLNYVPDIPDRATTVEGEGWQIGIWLSGAIWKSPHPMLAAMKMVPGCHLNAAGLDARARNIAEHFDIPVTECHANQLPHARLLQAMRRTHLTLYVTFCECCPMTPLESLSVGVPCLIGPTSHLFEDDPYLFERLVVPFPDRADVIATYLQRALRERDEIIKQYQRYAPAYNEKARRSVEEFLA